ncbi:MAG: ABC transporter ATP-binding protein [Clostridiales bacterium]|nr:ABC transporter ATP-binding protein [Candidatus Blautia equi]
MLEIKNLSVNYGSKTILDQISFRVNPGEWLMIMGPNGSGKSTTVNAISGGISYDGEILLDGKNVKQYKRKDLAAKIGILLQNHYVGYGFTVEEVVGLGRYAHKQGLFSSGKDESEELVERALALTGMDAYRKQSILTLSGGELQRTFLAQLLAQDPEIMILDEPTNHLDLVYQKQVFELIEKWRETTGRTVISVVHDLSLARAYGTHGVLLQKGKTVAYGAIEEIITPEIINPVYAMDVYQWMRDLYGQWSE